MEIPDNYYIKIESVPGPISKAYEFAKFSEDSVIAVYKSLDRESNPKVEHVVEIGSFKLKGIKRKSSSNFLLEIRKGIEDLISQNKS